MADDPSTALLIIDMFSRFDFPGAQELAPAAERAARQIRNVRRTQRFPVGSGSGRS